MDTVIKVTVGYMLKVMKAELSISQFKKEFAAIRHGNYYTFIRLIGGSVPTTVVYDRGMIRTDYDTNEDDFDFLGMIKSEPSLKIFYRNCVTTYGKFMDPDVSDDIFQKLVQFELGIRMHASNNQLTSKEEDLNDVIKKIGKLKDISSADTKRLQKGREFLNMVKHKRMKFPSWSDGIDAFLDAFEVQNKYELTII